MKTEFIISLICLECERFQWKAVSKSKNVSGWLKSYFLEAQDL
jgi:hypothetical protein